MSAEGHSRVAAHTQVAVEVHGPIVVRDSAVPRVSGATRMCEPEEPAAHKLAPAVVHT